MDVDYVPELVGNGVRLRELRDGDILRRASLGRSREIDRGFGGDLDEDEPMTDQDAVDELRRRFGPGPHWVIADQDDVLIGIVRLAPIDAANRSARLGIGILDAARLGQGPMRGVDGFAQVVATSHAGCEQQEVTIEDIFCTPDRAVARIRWQGRRPNGERVGRETIDIIRVENGRAVEHWGARA